MMSKQQLSMVEATLPPGFRFHPRDHELICDYLSNKVHLSQYSSLPLPLLLEVDLNKCEPWDLPESCCVGGKEWYLYSQRDRKYATGLRTNRATVSGYWKATGKDRCIHDKHKRKEVVGMRKTLVFYLGRAPKGKKTDWVMHEFRLPDSTLKEDWVLCRVFCKNREAIDNKERHDQDQDQDQDMTSSVSCGSSSLPPLMNMNMNMMFSEQVPCFSNPPVPDPKPFSNTSNYISPSNCCQKKDIFKSILSRFNMTDNHHSMLSFGTEGHQEQSFLSDVALPVTMWYP